jgi:hypothetical protein
MRDRSIGSALSGFGSSRNAWAFKTTTQKTPVKL